MAADPIQVAVEDEVPAVIERIRRSSADEVQLVVPARSRFGQSRFNFQLLRQYCTRLGKRVAIATPDPAVQKLAEESGFGAVRVGGMPDIPTWPPAPAARPAATAGVAPSAHGLVPPAPGAGGPLAGLGRIVTRPSQVGARIRIGAPQRLPGKLSQFQPARSLLYVVAGLLLVGGLLAAAFAVPSARVRLVAQAQPFSVPVTAAADPGKGAIHVRVVTLTRSASRSGNATGTKAGGGQYAVGQFTYVNACPQALAIPNGQRLQAANGTLFAQLGDVPRLDRGQQTTVSIKAVQPGQVGNVGPGQITGIENNQFNCLQGTNQQATNGGAEDQKATVIQSSDLLQARTGLQQDLHQAIVTEFTKPGNIQKGEKLPDSPVFTNESFKTDHAVDDNVPHFTATLTVTAEADYYMAADVDQIFASRLRSRVPAGKQLTTNKIAVTIDSAVAVAGGHIDFNGTASGFVAPQIDTERIRGQLVGKSRSQASEMLRGLPVRRADIQESPLPLPLMPLTSSRITIDYGIDQTAPAPKTT
jgi:hypothetical protein